MSEDWFDLEQAYAHGIDGGSFVIIDSSSSSPVEIAHLRTRHPRSWLVTLCALDPVGGIIGGDAGSVDRKLLAQLGLKARIQWGGDNATEIADVDWPIGGRTIALNAKAVRVWGLPTPGVLTVGTIRPRATAFLAPNTHGRGNVMMPTLTTDLRPQGFAVGAFTDFEVPKRAVAYRICGWFEDAATGDRGPFDEIGSIGSPFKGTVFQLAAPASDLSADWLITGAAGAFPVGQVSDAAAWIPLLASTTRIRFLTQVSPGASLSDMQVQCEFALDLG